MKIEIFNADCSIALKHIADNSVDITVTSPPYDNLRDYGGNSNFTFDTFKVIAQELYRVTKPGGVVVWNVNDECIDGSESGTSFRQALYFKEIGFNIHDTMIWDKESCVFPNVMRYYSCFEYMFVFSKGKPAKFHPIEDRPNKEAGRMIHGTERKKDGSLKISSGAKKKTVITDVGRRFNVWRFSGVKGSERTGHPAQFPEKLAIDHIISLSDEGDTVLDPFMGSGTTGVAAVKTNRNFIGIEIFKEYFDLAKNRIDKIKEYHGEQEAFDL